MGTITRRQFVVGSLVLGGSAVMGFSGCAPSAPESIEKTGEMREADVIVLGAGGAGIAAAASASEQGARVIVLEAGARYGGATTLSGGHMAMINEAMNAKLDRNDEILAPYLEYDPSGFGEWAEVLKTAQDQIRAYLGNDDPGRFDSVELLLIDQYRTGSGVDLDGASATVDLGITKAAAEANMDVFQWLTEGGMKIEDTYYKKRANSPVNGGSGLMEALMSLAEGDNVEIVYSSRASELIVEDGKVVGVTATDNRGEKTEYRASKGVILATGGFSANAEMAADYQNIGTGLTADLASTNPPTNFGDGIVMAQELGAGLRDMQFMQTVMVGYQGGCTLSEYGKINGKQQLVVNAEGKRYCDESSPTMSNLTNNQTDAIAYFIGDKKMHDALSEANMLDRLVDQGWCFVGDSSEEAAQLAGLDAKAVAETVSAFNAFVDGGADEEFGRTTFNGKAESAPFVITRMQMSYHLTFGGLVIDPDTHVLDEKGDAIPGLYAAGDVVSGYEGDVHQSGECLLSVVYQGRTAGKAVCVEN